MSVQSKLNLVLGLSIYVMISPLNEAFAFGGAKPTPPPYILPNPARHVIVRPFQNVNEFETPNQVTTTVAQAQAALGNILDEVVTRAGLSVIQGGDVGSLDPCGKHLEIWPAVTDFTMEAMSANITFGFNSTGPINIGQPQATAQDTVRLGKVRFEFTMYECDNAPNGSCTSLVAADADQTVVGNDFQFTVTYGMITGGGDIINKTDLGKAAQNIMGAGMGKLMNSPSMATVPWSTTVVAVNGDGSITMLAGADQHVQSNQYFTVYAKSSATSACGVFDALACVATTEVDTPSSIATVYKTLQAGQSRRIEVGDVVMVGSPACAPSVASNAAKSASNLIYLQGRGRL